MSFLIGLFSPVFSQCMSPFDSLFAAGGSASPYVTLRPVLLDHYNPRVNTRLFIYEAYKDEEAVLAHKQTPHYLACVEKLEDLMSEPRKKRCFVGLMSA